MKTVRNILLTQLAVGLVCAAAVWIWLGSERAVPTLIGGLIGVVPNAFLAAMFAAVFATLKPLHPEFLFAGYIATLLALPVALLFDGDERSDAQGGR